jgi:hypothetical protein
MLLENKTAEEIWDETKRVKAPGALAGSKTQWLTEIPPGKWDYSQMEPGNITKLLDAYHNPEFYRRVPQAKDYAFHAGAADISGAGELDSRRKRLVIGAGMQKSPNRNLPTDMEGAFSKEATGNHEIVHISGAESHPELAGYRASGTLGGDADAAQLYAISKALRDIKADPELIRQVDQVGRTTSRVTPYTTDPQIYANHWYDNAGEKLANHSAWRDAQTPGFRANNVPMFTPTVNSRVHGILDKSIRNGEDVQDIVARLQGITDAPGVKGPVSQVYEGGHEIVRKKMPDGSMQYVYKNFHPGVDMPLTKQEAADYRKLGLEEDSKATVNQLRYGGDPSLYLAHGTDTTGAKRVLKPGRHLLDSNGRLIKELSSPSFAVSRDKLIPNFGQTYLVPQLGKFDPTTSNSSLYNRDAWTDTIRNLRSVKDSSAFARLHDRFNKSPPASSYPVDQFKSFADYEASPKGAGVLTQKLPVNTNKKLSAVYDDVREAYGASPFNTIKQILKNPDAAWAELNGNVDTLESKDQLVQAMKHQFHLFQQKPSSYGELKVHGPVQVSPHNFAGIIGPSESSTNDMLRRAADLRGLPYLEHDFGSGPEGIDELLKKYRFLQKF